MSECTHDCSTCGENCAERKQESFLKSLNPYSSVKKVIAVVSGKGGVGKSLVTSMLASEMQRRGHSCAILDADITGPSIPKAFGITEKAVGDGEFILPAVSRTGVKIMSVNLLLENDDDPVVWRLAYDAAIAAGASLSAAEAYHQLSLMLHHFVSVKPMVLLTVAQMAAGVMIYIVGNAVYFKLRPPRAALEEK